MSNSQNQTKATSTIDVGLNLRSPSFEPGDDQQDSWNLLNQNNKNKATQIVPRINYFTDNDNKSRDEQQISSRSSPPGSISKKVTEETSTKPPPPTSVPYVKTLSKRKVNGIWDPCNTTDITVHLALSTQEDLDEILEEFYRLQRLGRFVSAKQFFAENLREHMERPQVLMGYIEMLLEQGDYKALSDMDSDTMNNACDGLINGSDRFLLTMHWELTMLLAAHYRPARRSVYLTKRDVVDEAIDELHAAVTASERSITSTEIKILALLYRLCDLVGDHLIPRRLREEFPSKFHEELYTNLLREGRIWDLRDIAVASISSHADITRYWGDTRSFVEDWSRMKTDTSTTLALLDILVSLTIRELEDSTGSKEKTEIFMRQSAPLALWIIEHDPESMKSRSFIRWMLAKAQFTDNKGPRYTHSFGMQLRSWPGVVVHSRRLHIPQYIPVNGENPGWKADNAAPKFERPVRMAMTISRELGDYQTEVIALQRLIVLSGKPDREFEELCNLQSITQGDTYGYSRTLTSRYLISNTEDSKQDLKLEISKLFDTPNFTNCISMLDSWILNMLQYSLEGDGPVAEQALDEAFEDYHNLPWEFRREIDGKFPAFQRGTGRTMNNSPLSRLESRFRGQRGQDTKENPEATAFNRRRKRSTTGGHDGLGSKLHIRNRNTSPLKTTEEYEYTDDSYETESSFRDRLNFSNRLHHSHHHPGYGRADVEPTATPQQARPTVSFSSKPRKPGPSLASGEPSQPTPRTVPSIYDQSQRGSEIVIDSNGPTINDVIVGDNRYRRGFTPGRNREGGPGLKDHLQNEPPGSPKKQSAAKPLGESTTEENSNPNIDGHISELGEGHQHERRPVTITEEAESGSSPTNISDNEKPVAEGGQKEDGQGTNQLDGGGKETHVQEGVGDVEHKGKEPASEKEEPRWLEMTLAAPGGNPAAASQRVQEEPIPSMTQTGPKTNPRATVESAKYVDEDSEASFEDDYFYSIVEEVD